MKKPILGYQIWFTQRSGSTFLCEVLANTELAGQPGEHIQLFEPDTNLLEKWNASDYPELRQHFWDHATSKNGICGQKAAIHQSRFDQVFQGVQTAPQAPMFETPNDWLNDWLPNCKHIYLTRRHRVRQVVSWWRAIQDDVWHRRGGQATDHDKAWYDAHYNFDALTHLFKESILMECAQQRYFDTYGIVPLTIVYEDMIQDLESTLKRIFKHLSIEWSNQTIQLPNMQVTATSLSEYWVDRFTQEMQTGWSEKAY
ncbi:MAG: Stf0 family sulfotransferase [Bacteroidota bacterium]